MSLPPYPDIRDPGVQWLGTMPSHWEVRRLKHLCKVFPSNVDKKSYDDQAVVKVCNYTDVYYNDVITSDLEFMLATASADEVEKFTLKAGDTIITKDSETPDDIAIAAYVPEDLPGVVCGYHLSMVRPQQGVSGEFIKRYFDSAFAKALFEVRANGLTRVGLGQYAVDNVDVPVPPVVEQVAIAAFLDRETDKIDALVQEQRRLIALLKEKRQAVISHAVTKGLDPTAPMKDSGIQWLGQVPASWRVVAAKHLISVATSGPRGWSDLVGDAGPIFFQSQNIGREMDIVLSDANRINPPTDADSDRAKLQEDDVVVCITGGRTGAVAHVRGLDETAYVNQHVCLLRPRPEGLTGRFLAYALSSREGQEQLRAATYGLKQGLGLEQLRAHVVCLPSLPDQRAIVAYLDKWVETVASLVVEAEIAITLLQERRAALISAAVTGKIDVRGWSEADVRKAVAAEIIYLHARKLTFGRVKHQKLLYLAEAHAGIHEIGGRYERQAAGPYDSELMSVVEGELETAGVMTVRQPDGRGSTVSYSVDRNWKHVRERLKAMLGDRLAAFDHVNTKLADLDTRGAEAVATLYAVWNDALIDGEACDDARVLRGFLDEWHPEKREKFREAELRTWLDWMRRNGLVPSGRGPRTSTNRLFT